jgi:adenosylmethionine-8-amino-7-oxononanoate aminotransferase
VDAALKIAYQYWRNQGESQRQRFLAFQGGYHGDTFGAMSVGKDSGFFAHFEDLLFSVHMFEYPETWCDDDNVHKKETDVLQKIAAYLEKHHQEVAAVIIEPLIQGAVGMRMCRSEFLCELSSLMQRYGILVIYDEVMTGFGRTGELFACTKAKTIPDLICLAKGISGGFLPLAATVCSNAIYDIFLGDSFDRALSHGHSYTANPLGCAAGVASLALLQGEETQHKIRMIEQAHKEGLKKLAVKTSIHKIRQCGTIAAFTMNVDSTYGSRISREFQQRCLAQGLLIRPLGNVVYLLPPYCIHQNDLETTYDILEKEL